jgi:hypothetical protein
VTPSDSLFQFVTVLPLPFWFLMIVLPRWRGTQRVMYGRLAVMPLLAAYAVLAVPHVTTFLSLFVRPGPLRLDDLAQFFGRPEIALVAWIHILAFDLFVGRWIYRDARERGISAGLMSPVLTLTMVLGPLGLLVFLLLRTQFRLEHANRT